MELDAKDHNWL